MFVFLKFRNDLIVVPKKGPDELLANDAKCAASLFLIEGASNGASSR